MRNSLLAILKNRQDEISPRMGGLIAGLYEDWISLDERIDTIASEIEKISEKEANLVSEQTDKGRIYRIRAGKASLVAADRAKQAA